MTQPSPLSWVALLRRGVTPPPGTVEFRFLKSGAKAWMPYPTFEEHPDTFNVTQVPAGQDAYFGVAFRKDDTSGKADNCQVTNLVWVDVDLVDHPEFSDGLSKAGLLEATPEDLKAMKAQLLAWILQVCAAHDLHVRAAVDSGHGIQAFFARRYGTDHADTERFNKALALLLGGDPKSTDVARILRLPGTLNLKNPKRPLLVEVVHQDPEAWVEDAALGALPLPEKPVPVASAPAAARPPVPAGRTKTDKWALAALHDECDIMRNTTEGGRNVQLNNSAVKLGSIVGNGALDEALVIQELTAAALAAGLEPDGIKATLNSGLTHGKNNPRDMNHVGKEHPAPARGTIGKARKSESEDITPQPPTSGVYVEHGGYYIDRPVKKGGEIVDWSPERLTNFVWEPTLELRYPGGEYGQRGTLSVRGAGQHELQLESKAWNSRKDLLEVLGGYQARCFTTNNSDVAKIGDYIAATYPELPSARGVKSYGLHLYEGDWIEVFEDQTISPGETPPLFYSGTPVDPGSRSFKSPRLGSEDQLAEARRAIVKLPGLVTPAVAYALLGYGAASAFSPRITPHLGNRLPFVYVAGERESGKTSGAQVALELMTGYSARLTKASGMTAYQYDVAHSSANNLLALLDEYRPGEIDDGQLRKHHDLGTKWRGSGVASKDLAYELNAPLIVLGEGFTDDAATKSRGVLYFTRKQDRGGLDGYSEMLKLPLWAYAGHLHELARTTPEDVHLARLSRATDLAGQAVGGEANPRLRYALTYIAYGLLVLQEDTEAIPDEAILDTLREGVHNTLEGGTEGVTNLELFLEQLAFVLTKVVNPGLYVVPGALPTDLLIRPKACLDLVQGHYKERSAIANTTLFKQYAEQASYFASGDVHKSHEGQPVRGKRVTLSQIPERCDADLLDEFNRRLRQ